MKSIIGLTMSLLLVACGNNEPDVIIAKTCALDAPAANSRMSLNQEMNVTGWAFDERYPGSQTKVRVQFKSTEKKETKTFDGLLNIKRPDIAAAFKNPKLEDSGFSVVVPANSMAPGNYEITILLDRPTTIVQCGEGYSVVME